MGEVTELALLVPGGHGQLGSDLSAQAVRVGTVSAPGSAQLDVTDGAAVRDAVHRLVETTRTDGRHPVVINAAAYTAVDAAEHDETTARAVNSDGPARLAAACAEFDVPLVHVSTDYVFDGAMTRPYQPEDAVGPRSVYGATKLAGERAVLAGTDRSWIVRTAWVYGAVGNNFVKTIARLERQRATLSVVDDQRGTPTWSADLAAGLLDLAAAIAGGAAPDRRVLHRTCTGETTWFGFARAIFAELGADPERVLPCATKDFPRPAPRPAYSVLSDAAWRAAGLAEAAPWRSALAEFCADHRAVLTP